MSDFEGRLTEVLRSESEAAPEALGLADAARVRARVRRRQRVAAIGAGAVAALALPVAVVALGDGGGGDGAPVADDPSTTTPVDKFPGRWETWRDVTVRVPPDWQYGDPATWCADGGSEKTFRVGRPGGVVPSIACTPGSSYGLTFQEIEMKETDEPFDWPVVAQAGDAWPPGTYVGAHGAEGVLVTVAGPDQDLVSQVLATVSTFRPVDPNGCSATDDGGPGTAGKDEVPVCRYDETGRLVQSEKLTGDDAIAAAEAVGSTPQEDGGNLCENPDSEYVVLGVEGERVEVRYAGPLDCADQGVFIEGLDHALTADVLYWALSPGWTGSAGSHAPLPPQLRQR
jgi:hypothetical protein